MISIFRHADEETLVGIKKEMRLRKTREVFLLFAMGSQFDHLIGQALSRIGVFCLVADPSSVRAEDVQALKPTGVILSGGPASVVSEPPPFDSRIFDLGIPVLGICLGFQMWAKHVGAQVLPAKRKEFGQHRIHIEDESSLLLKNCREGTMVLQSHGDQIYSESVPEDFFTLASTENCLIAAANYKHFWGVQFHPEVSHTEDGEQVFENFCFEICKAKDQFPRVDVGVTKARQMRTKIMSEQGNKKVLLALSGGCDSMVVCALLKKAVNGKPGLIRAVYIQGVDREDDLKYVAELAAEESSWLELKVVDATEEFATALRGVSDPVQKRQMVRQVYKMILESEIADFGADFIAQGTLYTDISESGGGHQSGARKAVIKQHHNVGLNFSVPELVPLADQVKDTAREIGLGLGLATEVLFRHPFPGPGLAVRVEGEIDPESILTARQADGIWIAELRDAGYYESVWQAGVCITKSRATFTKGDDAGFGKLVVIWAVNSVNGFTATAAEFPPDFLRKVAKKITNEVGGISSVAYRVSDKPPSTIEWE